MGGQKGDVLPPLTQRGHVDLDHVQPVEQILPKAPVLHGGLEILVGGRDKPDVHLDGLGTADTLEDPLLQDPQELDLNVRGEFADFVQKERSSVRQFEPALFLGHGPGKRAFFVTKEFAFQGSGIQGHAVHRNERGILPPGGEMDGSGNEFLAGAGFAGEQHGGAAGGNPVHHSQYLMHGSAPADDLVQAVAFFQVLAQETVALLGLGKLVRLVDRKHEFVVGKGLGNIVEGAAAHRFHRAVDGAVGSHDHDRDVGIFPFDLFQNLLAAHPRHLHVCDEDVHLGLLQEGNGQFRVVQGGDGVSGVLEQCLQNQQVVFLVVDNEDMA